MPGVCWDQDLIYSILKLRQRESKACGGGGCGLQAKQATSQVFCFALVSGDLATLSVCSMMEKKYEKIESCEWSTQNRLNYNFSNYKHFKQI